MPFDDFTACCLPEVPFEPLNADLYFPMGEDLSLKMVKIHAAGEVIPAPRRAQLLAKGVRILWAARDDEEKLIPFARVKSPELAACLLDACLCAGSPKQEDIALTACLQILRRKIALRGTRPPAQWLELETLARSLPQPTHSVRVSAIALLFSLLFHNDDPLLLADLAVAAFLHDIGKVAAGDRPAPDREHPKRSVRLIERIAPSAPERARLWISQHRERFGGSGFPSGLEGYQIDDISQLLGAADLIDELASGGWDGKRRGFRGAFEALGEFDRVKTFPQLFNPELLKTLLDWPKRTNSIARSAAA